MSAAQRTRRPEELERAALGCVLGSGGGTLGLPGLASGGCRGGVEDGGVAAESLVARLRVVALIAPMLKRALGAAKLPLALLLSSWPVEPLLVGAGAVVTAAVAVARRGFEAGKDGRLAAAGQALALLSVPPCNLSGAAPKLPLAAHHKFKILVS